MDEQKHNDEPNSFKTKEEFEAEVDLLIEEGKAITNRLYDFGIRMAKDGMLSSGAADAYLGMKATIELLNGLKDGSIFKQIEEQAAAQETLENNPSLNKYLN